jgi:hypothetical protein
MNALIAVVVAFLANGDMDYAVVDATDEADCKQKFTEIAHLRLDQNEQEDVKVVGFNYQCIELENKFPIAVPSEPTHAKPHHIPGDHEA